MRKIVDKEFLNKLKDFGLNAYESKLWTALLSRGVSTAGELSDIANVPRSRSYDVLESLEKKGFIVMKLGKPINYVAVPPHEVLERVKKKIVETSERDQKMIEDLKRSEVLEDIVLETLTESSTREALSASLASEPKGTGETEAPETGDAGADA